MAVIANEFQVCILIFDVSFHLRSPTPTAPMPQVVAVGLQSISSQVKIPVPLHCILCQAVEKDAAMSERQFVIGMRVQR